MPLGEIAAPAPEPPLRTNWVLIVSVLAVVLIMAVILFALLQRR
jgi:hypothetical protein